MFKKAILNDANQAINDSEKTKGVMKEGSSTENTTSELKDTRSESSRTIRRSHGFLTGIFHGCLKPVCWFFTREEKSKKDPWIIPFNALTEIRLVGSGAQGAVFLGHYKNEEVAIKKVKNERDTDIRHLRHLDHRNIVKFRYSKISSFAKLCM